MPLRGLLSVNLMLVNLFGIVLLVGIVGAQHISHPETGIGEVRVGPRLAFTIEASVGGISPHERADIVNRRIERVLAEEDLDPASIQLKPLPDGTVAVAIGQFVIVGVTEADAKAKGKTVTELAEEWARILRIELTQLKPLYAKYRRTQVKPLSEHHILLLILQVALLLLAARAGGELMRRLGQPPVIGNLLAGIILGYSVLGKIFPGVWAVLFPIEAVQSYLLEVVAWLGVIFLITLTGMEVDIGLIRQQGKSVVWLGVMGIGVSFIAGVAFGAFLPNSLLTSPETRWLLAFFLGATLSVSSVPVIAKILTEMGLLKRNIGQLTLATALAHDVLGWLILAAVAGAAATGSFNFAGIAKIAFGTIAFCAFSFTLGRRLLYAFLRWVSHHVGVEHALLTAVTLAMLVSAAIAQFLGIHATLGAFVVGVLLSESATVSSSVIRSVEAVTTAIFAPLFFAVTGLTVNLDILFQPSLLALTLAFTAVAGVSKILGSYWGGKLCGLDKWEATAIGLGTSVRGAMGLIVGIVGFSLGILTLDMFSIVIVMAVLTTVIAPPLMKRVLARVSLADEEQQRLQQEEIRSSSFGGNWRRILLATSGGPNSLLAARLMRIWGSQRSIDVTAIFVNTNSSRNAEEGETRAIFEPIASELQNSQAVLQHRIIHSPSPVDGILEECSKGYDLLVIGYGRRGVSQTPDLGVVTGEVILRTQCPTIVVRAPKDDDVTRWQLRHLLVPATSSLYALQAAQWGILLANAAGAQVTLLYVIEEPIDGLFWLLEEERSMEAMASEVICYVREVAETFGVPLTSLVRSAPQAAPEILRVADEIGVDLILLGSAPRLSRHLFFGPTITYILHHARCAVAVVKP